MTNATDFEPPKSHSPSKSKSKALASQLLAQAEQVLHENDHGKYIAPAKGLYPHQWLWDSSFHAIGLRHLDVERAKHEVLGVLGGQWANGMLPHMIFRGDSYQQRDWGIWHSKLNPNAPDDVETSGITQPPMLAEAIVRIGQMLTLPERRSWYKQVYPQLLAHHQWLYRERDPQRQGLTVQIHSWETGLDNTPPWMSELHGHLLPLWVRIVQALKLADIVGSIRTDTKFVSQSERLTNVEALALYSIQRRLRRKRYDMNAILKDKSSIFKIEDLSFNSILIRANDHLQAIAKTLRVYLPSDLIADIERSRQALEALWDPYTRQYYSRDFSSQQLLKEPSVATLLPLYAGCISQERAKILVGMLEQEQLFGPAFPIPSVPVDSDYFNPVRYWQGPTWVNMNWLIIDGLQRYGFQEHAAALRESTIEMVATKGIAEYYNPLTGDPLGADNFSWTAALVIDMIKAPSNSRR